VEGQIALRSLTQRFPKMESNELRYKNQITIRGLAELRVGW
jgi:cytochrome P450